MNNDLISRSALLLNVVAVSNSRGQVTWSAVSSIDILNAPAVDAVEVVRCRDCVYYLESNRFCCHIDGMSTAQDEMSFCSHGERRADYGR